MRTILESSAEKEKIADSVADDAVSREPVSSKTLMISNIAGLRKTELRL